MYWKRWLTALVILPPFILLIFKGHQLLFTSVIIAIAAVCLWEYFRIAYSDHKPPVPLTYSGWGYLCGAIILFLAYQQNYIGMLITLALNLVGIAAMSILRFKINQDAPMLAIKQIFGTLYIPLSISFIIMLRVTPQGPMWVFFFFFCFFFGRYRCALCRVYLRQAQTFSGGQSEEDHRGRLGGTGVQHCLCVAF